MKDFVKRIVEETKTRRPDLCWRDTNGEIQAPVDPAPYGSNQALTMPGSSKDGDDGPPGSDRKRSPCDPNTLTNYKCTPGNLTHFIVQSTSRSLSKIQNSL